MTGVVVYDQRRAVLCVLMQLGPGHCGPLNPAFVSDPSVFSQTALCLLEDLSHVSFILLYLAQ